MLLYVLQSKGSSPGRQGFFMAVNAGGEMQGSIGGGIMEHKFTELALEKLNHKKYTSERESNEPLVKKQVHDKKAGANQSGMICSGEQIVLLYEIKQADELQIYNIIHSLGNNKNGTLQLSSTGLNFSETIPRQDFEFTMTSEASWLYKEKTGYKNHLFIIGGGHCALALSRLMSTMDFYIRLYEDRSELNTMLQNEFVREKKILGDYSELSALISSGSNHYVVIMTAGYRTDYTAAKALLDKHFKYLGILGSKKKMEKLYAAFENEGIQEKKLKHVYTPIGLSINSHTPEEIAVSIAAEIIMVKNKINQAGSS